MSYFSKTMFVHWKKNLVRPQHALIPSSDIVQCRNGAKDLGSSRSQPPSTVFCSIRILWTPWLSFSHLKYFKTTTFPPTTDPTHQHCTSQQCPVCSIHNSVKVNVLNHEPKRQSQLASSQLVLFIKSHCHHFDVHHMQQQPWNVAMNLSIVPLHNTIASHPHPVIFISLLRPRYTYVHTTLQFTS